MSTDAYIICEDCGEELELVNIQKWKWRDSFAYKIKPCQTCIQEAVNRVVVSKDEGLK